MEFTLALNTIPDVADSDVLDRLAEQVYDCAALIDPLLALNEDGSIDASFGITAATALAAVREGVALFFDRLVQAQPLRLPTPGETRGAEEILGLRVAPAATFADRDPARARVPLSV